MNYFNSALTLINSLDVSEYDVAINYMREGMNLVNSRLSNLQKELKKKKDYITVEAPIQWAQNLNYVFIEVRYAHRHDAPGCSSSSGETIELSEDELYLSVVCLEQASKIRYIVRLQLWDKINVTESKHEYQSVGRHHFTLKKLNFPARWRQLWKGDIKPLNYRLWLEHHEKNVQTLWEFDGDEITDFEGYQWMEEHEENYREYQKRKQIPKKGPIPLEKKKKKKKQKSQNKKEDQLSKKKKQQHDEDDDD